MLRRAMEFKDLLAADQQFIDKLERYLKKREQYLLRRIAELFLSLIKKESFEGEFDLKKPTPQSLISFLKNSLAEKRTADNLKSVSSKELSLAADQINQFFWEYVEILESCIVDLSQETEQLRIDLIEENHLELISGIGELLKQKVKETITFFKQIKVEVDVCQSLITSSHSTYSILMRWFSWGKSLLDSGLQANLNKTLQFLKAGEKELDYRFKEYLSLEQKVQKSLLKFKNYRVLQALELEDKKGFEDLYRLLKLWVINSKTKVLAEQDIVRIFKGMVTVNEATKLFKRYCLELRMALFSFSRQLKQEGFDVEEKGALKEEMEKILAGYSAEIHTLGSSVERYREFLLRTDPNPYVRSRWGFSEGVVGPEPQQTKSLMQVAFELESLDALIPRLKQALQKQDKDPPIESRALHQEVQSALHEMSQPLASRSTMKKRAENLVILLERCEELETSQQDVIPYVAEVLAKALKADWRYHVLHENTQFHQIYTIHMGVVGAFDSPLHTECVKSFQRISQSLQKWSKRGMISSYTEELEQELLDLKSYFKKFRESLDGLEEDSDKYRSVILQKRHELLEYRYLFASFCYQFSLSNANERLVRRQYQKIDPILDSIEVKLNEMEQVEEEIEA